MSHTSRLSEAVRAWEGVLGSEHVQLDQAALASAGTATFKTEQQVVALLRPATTGDVQACVRVANEFGIPLYPVSGGKNWGLGSRVPVECGSALIDLTRMDRISDFDEELAYVTLEPGVTFVQLAEFLESRGSGLMMDSIGGAPEASIIGNTAERGHGLGVYADRFNHVCGLEVVLPGGELITTGFERFRGSCVGKLCRWGVGPWVDGLFTQSNLGIITRMTLWLRPRPPYFQTFRLQLHDDDSLAVAVDGWRRLRLAGIQGSLRIFNDYRMLSFTRQYPWERSGGVTPLPAALKSELKAEAGVQGKWLAFGALYSFSERYAAADRASVVEALSHGGETRIEFFDRAHGEQVPHDAEARETWDFLFRRSPMQGYVSDRALNMGYWRKRSPPPREKDLDRDRCGVLWFCPAIPCRGQDAVRAGELIERVSLDHGFEPNLGFLFISERALNATGALCYDRDVEGEDERAIRCHDELMRRLLELGYPPYRLGVQSMSLFLQTESTSLHFLQELKDAIDPNGILAPGRYIPAGARPA